MRSLRFVLPGVALALLSTAPAYADSISPTTFSGTLAIGGSVTISKTVTVTETTEAPVDIFFLTDTTGSMGGTIATVQTGFTSLVSSLSGVASNIAFGVGQYKDAGDVFAYNLDQDFTTSAAAAQTAINSWVASGGGDTPEANLYGLTEATTAGWRPGSERFVVWSGDAEGHDPSVGATLASTIAALTGIDATVIAANVGFGGLDASGQATAITTATGGTLLSGAAVTPANLLTAITDALATGISTYSNISLVAVGLPAGVSVAFNPLSYMGAFDRSIDRIFNFDVTFTGLAAGSYDFDIVALLDGTTVIGTERDHIDVTDVPEPATLTLLGLGLAAGIRRLRQQHGLRNA